MGPLPSVESSSQPRRLRRSFDTTDRRLAYLLLLPSALMLLLMVLLPFIHVLLMSLQDLETGESSGPFIGMANFVWVLGSGGFKMALVNSLVWTFGSVGLEMVVGLGVAMLLHQRFYLRGVARALVLFPYLVPTIVAVLVWRYMFHDLVGVVNYALVSVGVLKSPMLWLNNPDWAMASVILVSVWKFFPFVVIALLGILQGIPQEQYEAARVDGAFAWQQFWYITLPTIMPVFLLSAVLRTIWTFDKFDIIYLLTGGGPLTATTTLPLLIYFKAFTDWQMGRAAAMAILTFAFLCIVLVVYFKLQEKAEERL